MLKTHHVRHNDLHLDNVLVKDGRLYLIDLHKMQIKTSFVFETRLPISLTPWSLSTATWDEDEKEAFFSVYGSDSARRNLEKEIGKLTARWFRKEETEGL